MRTTVDIPDEIYRDLKIMAVQENQPVRQIILRGIQRELETKKEKPVRKLKLPLIRSKHPGTLHLTNEQIEQILTDDLISSGR
jgi:hypothetical protein